MSSTKQDPGLNNILECERKARIHTIAIQHDEFHDKGAQGAVGTFRDS